MKLEVKDNCPLNGFEPCKQFDCAWFMKVQGNNPNTGEPTEEWGCSMAWLPILLILAIGCAPPTPNGPELAGDDGAATDAGFQLGDPLIRGDLDGMDFTAVYLQGGTVCGAFSVERGEDIMAVRELLGREVDTAALCDEDTDLWDLVYDDEEVHA